MYYLLFLRKLTKVIICRVHVHEVTVGVVLRLHAYVSLHVKQMYVMISTQLVQSLYGVENEYLNFYRQ